MDTGAEVEFRPSRLYSCGAGLLEITQAHSRRASSDRYIPPANRQVDDTFSAAGTKSLGRVTTNGEMGSAENWS